MSTTTDEDSLGELSTTYRARLIGYYQVAEEKPPFIVLGERTNRNLVVGIGVMQDVYACGDDPKARTHVGDEELEQVGIFIVNVTETKEDVS